MYLPLHLNFRAQKPKYIPATTTMGANQSQPLPNEKLVIERLRDFQLQAQDDNKSTDDFVHVNEKRTRFRAPWTSLSSQEIGDWEHALLQDPKNRYVCHAKVQLVRGVG